MNKERDCEDCFKIKCKNCGWEPSEEEYQQIVQGNLKACPVCGGGK